MYPFILFLLFLTIHSCEIQASDNRPVPGALQTERYFPMLENKRVAVAGNHTSGINDTHLVDSLLATDINVVKVFSPEHGFRGEAAAGELVDNSIDDRTGLPIVSLYCTNRRPSAHQLADVDVILFDIQDVGTRFYTYISTMTYIMEEAARQDIPMIILDRPNPNGHYVDGPLLEPEYSSFVGLHPIPIVHGMTIGEYALMVNGERWLPDNLECQLQIITIKNYSHNTRYEIPLPPSPNLPNMHAIYLYPSLCLFEGTVISLGRGTNKPFQVYGHPDLPKNQFPYQFTPESVTAAPNPPQLDKKCQGINLSTLPKEKLQLKQEINLEYILQAYHHFPGKDKFFNNFFERLAGTGELRRQIKAGYTEEEIRASWQEDLRAFKTTRSEYLLYPDFE